MSPFWLSPFCCRRFNLSPFWPGTKNIAVLGQQIAVNLRTEEWYTRRDSEVLRSNGRQIATVCHQLCETAVCLWARSRTAKDVSLRSWITNNIRRCPDVLWSYGVVCKCSDLHSSIGLDRMSILSVEYRALQCLWMTIKAHPGNCKPLQCQNDYTGIRLLGVFYLWQERRPSSLWHYTSGRGRGWEQSLQCKNWPTSISNIWLIWYIRSMVDR